MDVKSAPTQKLDPVKTRERVPGHQNYYEKDGLRTYGDEEDHDHEPPWTFSRVMSIVAMAFLWTGSQVCTWDSVSQQQLQPLIIEIQDTCVSLRRHSTIYLCRQTIRGSDPPY